MTTQAELLELAKKYRNNSGIRLILLSLSEARQEAEKNIELISPRLESFKLGIHAENGHGVHRNQSEFVMASYKLAASMEHMASDFFNLATILEGLGEEISY